MMKASNGTNKVYEHNSPEAKNTAEHLDLMVKQVESAMSAAMDYANEHGLDFYIQLPGSHSSVHGAAYRGKGSHENSAQTYPGDWFDYYGDDEDSGGWGWNSSSDFC